MHTQSNSRVPLPDARYGVPPGIRPGGSSRNRRQLPRFSPGARRTVLALACVLALGLGTLGARNTLAWFTDRDSVTNPFVYGNVDILPFEPSWTEPQTPGVPGQSYPKDPAVASLGGTDAVVFAEISVPVENIALADPETGALASPAGHPGAATPEDARTESELFWLKRTDTPDAAEENAFGEDWILLEKTPGKAGGNAVYLLGYRKILPPSGNPEVVTNVRDPEQAAKLDSKTTPVFDRVQFRHFVEGTASGEYSVLVQTYAIQARFLEDGDGNDLTASCYDGDTLKQDAVLSADTLKTIFALYGTQTGKEASR